MNSKLTTQAVEDLLPQTQCGDCGYKGCAPYAKAIVENNEKINKCLPGGIKTLHALAGLCEVNDINYKNLEAELLPQIKAPAVAVIRENECIGCTKCIQACPVDAIIGSGKLMHTVISNYCTGCGLCVAPCPMDCIDLIKLAEPGYDRGVAKKHYDAKLLRGSISKKNQTISEKKTKQEYIQRAIERVKMKRNKNF